MKKAVYTLNIDNYSPEVTKITYPLLKHFADKIKAEFIVISERKFPGWPVVYEKLQIHELGREYDWNIYIDSDALVHPDMFDPTCHLNKNIVMHNGKDMAGNRWRYNEYFLRDGRHIGSCNWFTVASNWCLDLWRPLDVSLKEAVENIFPTLGETSTVITRDHLIDDYTLSSNIARFGLKFKTMRELLTELGAPTDSYFYHEYTVTTPEKVKKLNEAIKAWKLKDFYNTKDSETEKRGLVTCR